MCGITGFISTSTSKENIIHRMNNKIAHRGPDEEGYYVDESIALGMKRLSIIDLSSGKQPIIDDDYCIVYNGELYNYKQLRRDLIKKGHAFKTQSDTEVILKMYRVYGINCLSQFNGMFVFAIWDKKKRQLFMARDRLGQKPLYYFQDSNIFVFGSEIKSILQHPSVKSVLNEKVINSYFQYRYILGDQTLFKDIYSLPPGSYLVVSDNTSSVKKYWELPIVEKKQDEGEDFYVQRTKKLVTEAVEKRMISDVPVGAYLSGGLDSSIVASVMAKSKGKSRLSTFTIGFEEEGFNEFKFANMVAEKWNTDHHEITLKGENYIECMEYLIEYKDAPLAVPNEVPLYLMSKELKKYITVVLSGEGADELFGGYGRIFRSYLEFNQGNANNFLDFFLQKYNYTSNQNLEKILNKDLLGVINDHRYTQQVFEENFIKTRTLPQEDKIPYIFQNIHLQGLLQRVDTTTMAASVEGRAPFVDHELVEFVNAIPFKYKIKWKNNKYKQKVQDKNLSPHEYSEKYDTTKYLLREAFKDYLPKKIINREKVGFPVPLNTWFSGDFKKYARDILQDKKTFQRGIYNERYLKSGSLFDEQSGMTIWMMINLELFMRKYFD